MGATIKMTVAFILAAVVIAVREPLSDLVLQLQNIIIAHAPVLLCGVFALVSLVLFVMKTRLEGAIFGRDAQITMLKRELELTRPESLERMTMRLNEVFDLYPDARARFVKLQQDAVQVEDFLASVADEMKRRQNGSRHAGRSSSHEKRRVK